MIFLHDKLNSAVDKKVSSKDIWNHLKEMYDLGALNDSDGLPFPNKEFEFSLPEDVSEDLSEKPFPRYSVTAETKIADMPSRRESIKDTVITSEPSVSKDATEPKGSMSASRTAKAAASQPAETTAKHEDTGKGGLAVDSPKPDPRKRTRHSLQSPQTEAATTPSSAKRTRRI